MAAWVAVPPQNKGQIMRLLPIFFAVLAVPAFAQDATVTPGNTLTAPPTEWLGEAPHLVMMGLLGGREVNVQILDFTAAEGIDAFEGKREYLPGDNGTWRFGDFEVALSATFDGVEKAFELEIENADFNTATLPATFTLQDVNFPEGALAYLEAQAEWETGGVTVNDEIGAWTGTVTLTLNSGTPDAEGLVPDGLIGGLLVAENGDDALIVSFTVPVVEYEKDE
jgi:hypothetical protein